MSGKGTAQRVKIEISQQTLARLVRNSALYPSEIHHLDPASKRYIWQICLEKCLK